MARIDFSIDPDRTPRIRDESSEDPDHVARGLRYCWIDLPVTNGDDITMHLASGLATDAGIIAATSLLIAALEELRTAARERIGDAEFRAELEAAPACERCDAPAIDHEDLAGACPNGQTWYKAGSSPVVDPGDHYVRPEAVAS